MRFRVRIQDPNGGTKHTEADLVFFRAGGIEVTSEKTNHSMFYPWHRVLYVSDNRANEPLPIDERI